MKKATTLSIEDDIADAFQAFCHEHGLNMSRQVELFMADMIKRK